MSYQVLARKWRPNKFDELVGQDHVVTAISNALDNNRLHHAYLFSGTRGVGKTTIARIFSKSLNCEQGLSAQPCGQCSTCQEIEKGHFIDLLEIDAASRTKVEDTRELLDNVQYKPSRGRYKVYLIDEVHMLSKHSFNALLKTLEEPPPHVKFLLATTDPQKLPVTILSRCLQFNLKALSRKQISQQLDFVLTQENIEFDQEALSQLARSAQGSMRDALSLTDQAIAQGNGLVSTSIVTDMLGLMDKDQVLKLVHALLQKDSDAVLQQVDKMAEQAADFGQILAEIMSLLHQIALTQFVPDACKLETISARAIFQLAKSVPPEQIQLLYQIALTGKKDLPFSADPRTGLEMTLLRMLAFSPSLGGLEPLDIIQQSSQVQAAPAEALALQQQPAVSDLPATPMSEQGYASDLPQPNMFDPQQTSESVQEQNLFEQQQDIMAQAQDFGHQPEAYEPQQAWQEAGQLPTPVIQSGQADAHQSTTADLIALRNKLKQGQNKEEEIAQQLKKSEPSALPNLASIRAQSHTNSDQTKHDLPSESAVSDIQQPQSKPPQNLDDIPPWLDEIGTNDEPVASPFNAPTVPPQVENFDPNGHLDGSDVMEVTTQVPVFLADQEKVTDSTQLDAWSRLIEDMQVTALTKQLALHSAFEQTGTSVNLTLVESKAHLQSESAEQQLRQALSLALQGDIQLEIVLGAPINTPYALQMKINQVREEYAHQVLKDDQGIQLLQEQFAAKLIQQSVQAR